MCVYVCVCGGGWHGGGGRYILWLTPDIKILVFCILQDKAIKQLKSSRKLTELSKEYVISQTKSGKIFFLLLSDIKNHP